MTRSSTSFRLLGILALAFAVAQCGDGGGDDDFDDAGSPPRGTFAGTLSAGGTIRLEVGSIEEIAFDCDGQRIQERFSPPQPIDARRAFDVRFTDGGRRFRVRGAFASDDAVTGTIDDQDDACDVTFTATRGDAPEPTTTPGAGETATRTPDAGDDTPTPTPTPTTSQPTCTTSCAPTPGETRTPGPTSTACPVAVEVRGDAGNRKVLDSGWKGLAHNATVISDGTLTFSLGNCDSTTRPCGVCDVGGPIQNVDADRGSINPRRCSNDTSIKCTAGSDCGGGTCEFYFGAPLPLSAGGISTCVTNQVNGAVTGTANVESGAFESNLTLTSKVHIQITVDQPCPTCNGDGAANDGTAGGTCNGGVKSGAPCDVNGTSPIPSFGTTSLDCPPAGQLGSGLTIALAGSSAPETMTLSASSPNCFAVGTAGKKCFCPYMTGEPTAPNACLDDTTTLGTVEACAPVAAGSTKGACTYLPVDRVCSPLETFRSCTSNSECEAAGDTCVPIQRPCYADNGVIGNSVTAVGEADVPTDGVAHPTFASLFCIPPVAEPSINAAGGLPGLGRLELPLRTEEIPTLP